MQDLPLWLAPPIGPPDGVSVTRALTLFQWLHRVFGGDFVIAMPSNKEARLSMLAGDLVGSVSGEGFLLRGG